MIDWRASSFDGNAAALPSAPPRRAGRAMELSCRALDLLGATAMLVVLAPLLGTIAVLVRLDSPGPVLFRQQRIGRDTEPFVLNKFRTMHHGVAHDHHREFVLGLINGEHPDQEAAGPRFKLAADERVTRFGRALRRTSLDELPQLWNVLRGEMSLVGPRPPIPYEVEHYPPHWFARFAVKPGLTGLWQVNGRSDVAARGDGAPRRRIRQSPLAVAEPRTARAHRARRAERPGSVMRRLFRTRSDRCRLRSLCRWPSLLAGERARRRKRKTTARRPPTRSCARTRSRAIPEANWQVKGIGDQSIQGYATSMSVNVGETEYFKIDTPASAYHIEILRLGYYGGDGARLVASESLRPRRCRRTSPNACMNPRPG